MESKNYDIGVKIVTSDIFDEDSNPNMLYIDKMVVTYGIEGESKDSINIDIGQIVNKIHTNFEKAENNWKCA